MDSNDELNKIKHYNEIKKILNITESILSNLTNNIKSNEERLNKKDDKVKCQIYVNRLMEDIYLTKSIFESIFSVIKEYPEFTNSENNKIIDSISKDFLFFINVKLDHIKQIDEYIDSK